MKSRNLWMVLISVVLATACNNTSKTKANEEPVSQHTIKDVKLELVSLHPEPVIKKGDPVLRKLNSGLKAARLSK